MPNSEEPKKVTASSWLATNACTFSTFRIRCCDIQVAVSGTRSRDRPPHTHPTDALAIGSGAGSIIASSLFGVGSDSQSRG